MWDGLEILFSFSLLDIIYFDFIFNHLIINFFYLDKQYIDRNMKSKWLKIIKDETIFKLIA